MDRISQLNDLLSADPNDHFLYLALAKEFEKLKEFQEAKMRYEYLLANFSDYSATYYHLGKLLEFLNENQEAKKIYLQGINLTAASGEQHAWSELKAALNNIEIDL